MKIYFHKVLERIDMSKLWLIMGSCRLVTSWVACLWNFILFEVNHKAFSSLGLNWW